MSDGSWDQRFYLDSLRSKAEAVERISGSCSVRQEREKFSHVVDKDYSCLRIRWTSLVCIEEWKSDHSHRFGASSEIASRKEAQTGLQSIDLNVLSLGSVVGFRRWQ